MFLRNDKNTIEVKGDKLIIVDGNDTFNITLKPVLVSFLIRAINDIRKNTDVVMNKSVELRFSTNMYKTYIGVGYDHTKTRYYICFGEKIRYTFEPMFIGEFVNGESLGEFRDEYQLELFLDSFIKYREFMIN
jgi:hypothetical protein